MILLCSPSQKSCPFAWVSSHNSIIGTTISRGSSFAIGTFYDVINIWRLRILPEHPRVIFRRASTIKNRIAQSCLWDRSSKAQGPWTFLSISGCYQCGKPRCKTCAHTRHGLHNFTEPKGLLISISNFITCANPYMVNGVACPYKSCMLVLWRKGLGSTV